MFLGKALFVNQCCKKAFQQKINKNSRGRSILKKDSKNKYEKQWNTLFSELVKLQLLVTKPVYFILKGFFIWASPGLFCWFFTVRHFITMIYKLGMQLRHFRIYDKLCLLSMLISAHWRESWVGVTVCLLALGSHHAEKCRHDVPWLKLCRLIRVVRFTMLKSV